VGQSARKWAAAVASVCALGGAALVLAQAPHSDGPVIRTAPITETSTVPYQAPPPPIMLPAPNLQVPCMGWAPDGCDNAQQ
jgi:hypothetical protein